MAALLKLFGPEAGPLLETGQAVAAQSRKPDARRWLLCAILGASVFVPAYTRSKGSAPIAVPVLATRSVPADHPAPPVWLIEKNPRFDVYSNGLRVENEFAVPGKPRLIYPVFDAAQMVGRLSELRSNPAGIVFHSTESQLSLERSSPSSVKQRNLLGYIRAQQSYHFVIDRVGRVFRVVAETGIAKHAGNSVWSDRQGVYLNLNASFLSVAFESQTDAALPLSAAQIHAGKGLTDMLRYKYRIAASNCVTHAQVSVNPSNMRIGYHTDWASGFPFAELGLPDNYAQMLPSMFMFGFDYDETFTAAAKKPWAGLIATERLLLEQAVAGGMSPLLYRQRLRARYRRIVNSAQIALD
jgi:hypothetical protein